MSFLTNNLFLKAYILKFKLLYVQSSLQKSNERAPTSSYFVQMNDTFMTHANFPIPVVTHANT